MILYPKVVTETGVTGPFAGFWRVTDLSVMPPIVRDALSTLAMAKGRGGVVVDNHLYRWMNSNADEPIGNNIFPMAQQADAYERPGLRIESLWGEPYDHDGDGPHLWSEWHTWLSLENMLVSEKTMTPENPLSYLDSDDRNRLGFLLKDILGDYTLKNQKSYIPPIAPTAAAMVDGYLVPVEAWFAPIGRNLAESLVGFFMVRPEITMRMSPILRHLLAWKNFPPVDESNGGGLPYQPETMALLHWVEDALNSPSWTRRQPGDRKKVSKDSVYKFNLKVKAPWSNPNYTTEIDLEDTIWMNAIVEEGNYEYAPIGAHLTWESFNRQGSRLGYVHAMPPHNPFFGMANQHLLKVKLIRLYADIISEPWFDGTAGARLKMMTELIKEMRGATKDKIDWRTLECFPGQKQDDGFPSPVEQMWVQYAMNADDSQRINWMVPTMCREYTGAKASMTPEGFSHAVFSEDNWPRTRS